MDSNYPSTDLLSAALAYAEMGLPCFPVNKKKQPACPNGFNAATKDERSLRALFSKNYVTGIGLPTGFISNIAVIDCDCKKVNGTVNFHDWCKANGVTPSPVYANTGGGGIHYLYKMPDYDLRCTVNILPCVDVRANGGYIVAPPSSIQQADGSWGQYVLHGDLLDLPPLDEKIQTLIAERKPCGKNSRKNEAMSDTTLLNVPVSAPAPQEETQTSPASGDTVAAVTATPDSLTQEPSHDSGEVSDTAPTGEVADPLTGEVSSQADPAHPANLPRFDCVRSMAVIATQLEKTPEGARNSTLFRMSISALRAFGDTKYVRDALSSGAQKSGLSTKEIDITMQSALGYAQKQGAFLPEEKIPSYLYLENDPREFTRLNTTTPPNAHITFNTEEIQSNYGLRDFTFEQESYKNNPLNTTKTLLVLPELPREALPPRTRRLVEEIATEYEIDRTSVLTTLLGLASACTGKTRAVKMGGAAIPASLWSINIGPLDKQKEAMSHDVYNALFSLERSWLIKYETAISDFKVTKNNKKIRNTKTISIPERRRNIVQHSTPEAIIDIMSQNQKRGLQIYAPRCGDMISEIERYSSSKTFREDMLKLDSPIQYIYDRKGPSEGKSRSIILNAPTLSFNGGMEASELQGFLGTRNKGFARRFFYTMSQFDRTPHEKPSRDYIETRRELWTMTKNLLELPKKAWREKNRFDDYLGVLEFDVWSQNYLRKYKEDNYKFYESMADYDGINWLNCELEIGTCLALLFYCMESALQGGNATGKITQNYLQCGLTLARWGAMHRDILLSPQGDSHVLTPVSCQIVRCILSHATEIQACNNFVSMKQLTDWCAEEKINISSIGLGRICNRLGFAEKRKSEGMCRYITTKALDHCAKLLKIQKLFNKQKEHEFFESFKNIPAYTFENEIMPPRPKFPAFEDLPAEMPQDRPLTVQQQVVAQAAPAEEPQPTAQDKPAQPDVTQNLQDQQDAPMDDFSRCMAQNEPEPQDVAQAAPAEESQPTAQNDPVQSDVTQNLQDQQDELLDDFSRCMAQNEPEPQDVALTTPAEELLQMIMQNEQKHQSALTNMNHTQPTGQNAANMFQTTDTSFLPPEEQNKFCNNVISPNSDFDSKKSLYLAQSMRHKSELMSGMDDDEDDD